MSLLKEKRLSVSEVAQELGVTSQAVTHWVRYGCGGVKLKALRVGSRYQILESHLEEWLLREVAEEPDDDLAERAARADAACEALGV